MLKGAARTAGGIASGNFVAVAQGAVEMLSPKVIAIILAILLFFTLLPVMIIASIPQLLFSWATVDDTELKARNEHGSKIAQHYEKVIDEQEEDVNPDKY